MINTLFTSVGRRVELLRAFRRAYQLLGLRGHIVALDMNPLAPALREADRRYLVPRTGDLGYVPAVLDVCRRERVDLVFPLIDPDIPALAGHAADLAAVGARLMTVSAEAAAVTRDKWLTARFFRRIGVPTARCWLRGDLEPERAAFPLFVKPRNGSAGKNAFKVNNPQELTFLSEYVRDAIVCEYLSGPEVTSDVACDGPGEVLAVVSRQRLETRSGEVSKGVTVHDPAVRDACLRIAAMLPAAGPITVQCIRSGGGLYFTEINARFGGGVPLAVAAGADVPGWLLARAAGIPVEVPPPGTYQAGLYMTRFDDSFFLTESEREQVPPPAGRAQPVIGDFGSWDPGQLSEIGRVL